MAWLLRKSATLIAVYSIALQAMFGALSRWAISDLIPSQSSARPIVRETTSPRQRNTGATALRASLHALVRRL